MPLIAACMNCGERIRVEPDASLYDRGWRYRDLDGWLCQTCQRLDLGKKRGAGQPPKR